MNISQILKNLGENRADFIEALSDASHYLGVALDLLDRNDQVTLRALMEAEQTISQVLTACEDDDAEVSDDDAGEIDDIIDLLCGDDDDAPQTSIRSLIISEFAGVA